MKIATGHYKSGASYGYVGAGGPGFTGPRDTVGSAARNTD